MIKYHQDAITFQALKENNIDRIQLQMIPANSRVLEIGCATGYMSEYLIKEKGCQVLGIEPVAEQAYAAIARGIDVKIGTVDSLNIQTYLDQEVKLHGPFDVLFMSQVIEHIAEPEVILKRMKDWLSPTGVLIISTCNIAHWKCRFRLLGGEWKYEEYGVFDKTHLRFFTIKSFKEMLSHCGYSISDFGFTFEDICPFKILFDTRILAPSDILRLIPFAGAGLRKRYTILTKNFIATQFVFKAGITEKQTL
jgi:methionine biosynthesis protein MetW